jgi:hypothetical protein
MLFCTPKYTTETQYVEVMGKEACDKIAVYSSYLQEQGGGVEG